MKLLTDEDYDLLLRWAEVFHTADKRLDRLRERYREPQQLFVVELDDPNTFPTSTWGPFVLVADAVDFITTQWNDAENATITKHDTGPVVRSYALDGGGYYHIKHLTHPN